MELRNKLIIQNMYFAERIAASQFKKTPSFISYDELKSAAYMGLTIAANRYNGMAPFQVFAYNRIVGEIKDYLRSFYWRNSRFSSLEKNDHSRVFCSCM